MRTFLIVICCFLITRLTMAQEAFVPFDPTDYADSTFSITQKIYDHGGVQIQLIQIKRKNSPTGNRKQFYYCRAWLNVLKRGKLLRQKYYDDFEPVGGNYGLFVPKTPPSRNFFAIVKHGDYQGALLLVDTQGQVTEYFGGEYLVTRDKRYVFSVYFTDGRGLEVIDLSTGKSVFRKETFPYPDQWYISGATYFFTSNDVPDSIFVWDSINAGFRSRKFAQNTLATSQTLEMSLFPVDDDNDCSCGK